MSALKTPLLCRGGAVLLAHRFRVAALLGAVALTAGGCGGSEGEAKSASEQKRLEIVHESCSVDSGSAIKTDVNGDGSFDIIKVMSGGKEVCRALDLNFDTVKDSFIYFDDAGNIRRRESDFDRDGRPDEIAVFQGGVVVSKELETNFDGKLDTWETYASGRLAKAERDSDGDGLVDEWWDYNRPDAPDCAVVISDRNADGQPDPDTSVDMCGESYKPPAAPSADAPVASSSATAAGSFGPPPASAAPKASASAAPAAPSASASGVVSGGAPAPSSSAPKANP